MQTFLSCDWGTTSFRLRLIDAANKAILAERITQQGIANTFDAWSGQPGTSRFLLYGNYITEQIQWLQKKSGLTLSNVPLIIAGMASSAIGMKELPYKKIPFVVQPQNLLVDVTEATSLFPHKTFLISGVCSSTDVMRGEETILAGCSINASFNKQLFILPGTHSKHVFIKKKLLTGIATYMTGELFQLLSTKSILSNAVEKKNTVKNSHAFLKGVQDATASSLLNNIFRIRVNTLFNTMNKIENYHYLSGLLIGEELKQVLQQDVEAITIVSSGNLLQLYHEAILFLNKKCIINVDDADKALIQTQTVVLQHYNGFKA